MNRLAPANTDPPAGNGSVTSITDQVGVQVVEVFGRDPLLEVAAAADLPNLVTVQECRADPEPGDIADGLTRRV